VISIKLQSLWSQFENLAMKEGEQVKDFFSRVTGIGNQIKSCGDEIPEKKVVEKILRSLPQKFEHVVAVIEETKDLTKLTQYELMGSLEAHEQRVNRYNNQPLENVFQAKMNIRSSNPQQEGRWDSFRGQSSNRGHGRNSGNRGRGERRQGNSNSYCLICKKPGHESKDCRFRCTRCKIPNHSDRDCWHKKKEGDERMKGINFSAEDDAHKLFSTMINDKKSGEIWFLHSGCSNHVIGNQNIFEELNKNYSSRPRELSSVGMDICAGAGVRTPDPGHSTYSP
jgi:hypothetical protein